MLVMERPVQTYISTKLRERKVLSLTDTLALLVEIRRYIEEFQLQKEYRAYLQIILYRPRTKQVISKS